MTLLELTVTAGIVAAAAATAAAYWSAESERTDIVAELRMVQNLAADFRRGQRCWTPAGSVTAPAMMAAIGRSVPISEPGAWSASFGTRLVSRLGVAPGVTDPGYMTMQRTRQWIAVHFTSSNEDERAALEGAGGAATGPTTVTVETPVSDPLEGGRRMMAGVREGPTGC